MSSASSQHGIRAAFLWLLALVVGVVTVITVTVNVNFSNFPGKGRALDYRTHRPIAGVKLKGDCRRSNFIHGTRSLKTLETQSHADGRYRFSFFDTWHCSEFGLYPDKPGYVDLLAAQIPTVIIDADFFTGVPAVTWMVKEADLVPLRLDGLFAETGGEMIMGDGSGRRAYFQEFDWTLQRFAEAKRIASTDAQRTWIKARFCPLLFRQFSAIPVAERDPASSSVPQFNAQVEDWRATCTPTEGRSG